MNIKDTLFSLTDETGVSGNEFSASEKAAELLRNYSDNVIVDDFGNVIAEIGKRSEDKPHILLDAHIDEIGLIVTYITDEGFLKVANVGGVDERLFLAQQVTIHGSKKLKGVITSTPPHLEDDDKKVPDVKDIYIDTGFTKEQAEKYISPGDRITIDSHCEKLLGTRLTSKAIDDRSGVAAILFALDKIKNKKLQCSLSVLFSSQEETGERGARTGAFKIQPDIAIAVDVSFALTKDESECKCGKMGKGVMIGIAPSLSKELSNNMICLAKEKKIPYQLEVMGGTTGTNADVIGTTGKGVKTVTLSIPLKYMHTPVEVVDVKDIEATGNLIAEYIISGGKAND